MNLVLEKADNILNSDFLIECIRKVQLPLQLLYYATDLVSCTSMYTDIEKQDYRNKIPEAHVIKDFLDTLEEKGYKLTTDSMIYGGYYEEITRYEQNMANIVPQNLLSGCDWTTKAWTPDTAYASSSHDCTYFETDVDNEDFNHFISVLQNITINT